MGLISLQLYQKKNFQVETLVQQLGSGTIIYAQSEITVQINFIRFYESNFKYIKCSKI